MKDGNLDKQRRRIQAKMDLIRLKTWFIELIIIIFIKTSEINTQNHIMKIFIKKHLHLTVTLMEAVVSG